MVPVFSGSPKDAIAPKQQEAILRTQRPHSQEVGWAVFGCSVGYGCLSLFMGVGYKLLLLVMVRKKLNKGD